jgi:hypothetical protein
MNQQATIIDVMDGVFREWFERGDWRAWRVYLKALFGLPMNDRELSLYRKHTARSEAPDKPFNEAWPIIGRRGGKSQIMALTAVYLACFRDYREYLAPGEVATIPLIATDRKQARTLYRYIKGFLQVPMLAKMVERETSESFELVNRVVIEIHTASYRSIRGYSCAAAICDEVAFWFSDGASPDHEIIAALRPALASIPGSMLIGASSPHAKRGELYKAFRRYHGKDGTDVLTWQADTRSMNPSIAESVVAQAYERDPDRARAEFGAQFRDDISTFVKREIVEACVSSGVHERGRLDGVTYHGFVDPSGGSSDSMTLCIGHAEDSTVIVDVIREARPPFSPESVTEEFAETFKSYGITRIQGDRYAGQWPREAFERHGIDYVASARPKSELYQALLPRLNAAQIDLLDNARLVNQICNLERRTARGGRDSIDHPPNAHDDVCNAVAGLASMAITVKRPTAVFGTYGADEQRKGYYMAEPAKPSRLFGTSGQEEPETRTYRDSNGNFHHY